MRVAYLVGMYPAVSLAFIAREIEAVRAAGVEVVPFSVHAPPEHELTSDLDRETAKRTRNIQPPDPKQVLRAHVQGLLRHPRSYLRTLALSQRLSPPGVKAHLWHLFYFLEAVLLWRWMRDAQVKHMHAHFANANSMISLLYAEFARSEGASWSFTMHGYTEFDEVTAFRLAEKVRYADFVVCISHFARSQLMKLVDEELWDKLHIVHCGVDVERFTPPPRPAPDPAAPVRILCVARLVASKGVGMLIDVVAELIDEGVALELEIIGTGPIEDELRARARATGQGGHIHLLGPVGQDHIRDHYAAADVFCLASFAEGIPVVLMEAMAYELTVVSTRIMGIPELIDEDVSGVFMPPGDPRGLKDALRRVAANPGLRTSLGPRARTKIVEEFDIAESGRELAELYRTLD